MGFSLVSLLVAIAPRRSHRPFSFWFLPFISGFIISVYSGSPGFELILARFKVRYVSSLLRLDRIPFRSWMFSLRNQNLLSIWWRSFSPSYSSRSVDIPRSDCFFEFKWLCHQRTMADRASLLLGLFLVDSRLFF